MYKRQAGLNAVDQSTGVDQCAACAVDDDNTRLHLLNSLGVDHVVGAVVEEGVQRDDIGLRIQRFERNVLHAHLLHFLGRERVMRDNAAAKAGQIVNDPYPSEEMKQMGVEYVSLESLYAQSDVITLHTFLNNSTYHMINTEAIQQMKPGVVIINCARGALIDTRALIDGIESGRVGSVGVDCFEGEDDVIRVDHNYNSRVTNHDYIILKSFQNTIVTPHVAFFTDQAVFDMVQCSLESLHQFELGEKVPLEVHAA